jgi:polyhydroxybutyrate depolymerase
MRPMKRTLTTVLFLFGWAACSPAPPAQMTDPRIDARPYDSNIPRSYDGSKPTPLVLLLHGYSASNVIQDAYFGLSAMSDKKGFLYAYPSGTFNSEGKAFWNATDACCDRDRSGVDDVGYLNAVVDDMRARYNVDDKRIFLIGHSNGGYMSHRMACESGSKIAGIISLAGATWKDPAKCTPTAHTSIVQAHGTDDATVLYAGGAAYPSAEATVATWAQKNGCTGPLAPTGTSFDVDINAAGAETEVSAYAGCARGSVELWSMKATTHIPNFKLPDWPERVWSWFDAHPRP